MYHNNCILCTGRYNRINITCSNSAEVLGCCCCSFVSVLVFSVSYNANGICYSKLHVNNNANGICYSKLHVNYNANGICYSKLHVNYNANGICYSKLHVNYNTLFALVLHVDGTAAVISILPGVFCHPLLASFVSNFHGSNL